MILRTTKTMCIWPGTKQKLKWKSSSKGGKKEDEQKDEETASEALKDEKNQKLAKLKDILESISADYERGRKESCGKTNSTCRSRCTWLMKLTGLVNLKKQMS